MAVGIDDATSGTVTKVNRMAVVSMLCAALAIAGTWLAGLAVLAVFAAGAGHVALQQIDGRHERGAALARVALIVSYAIAVLVIFQALFLTLRGV
jgi:hypothetical protein